MFFQYIFKGSIIVRDFWADCAKKKSLDSNGLQKMKLNSRRAAQEVRRLDLNLHKADAGAMSCLGKSVKIFLAEEKHMRIKLADHKSPTIPCQFFLLFRAMLCVRSIPRLHFYLETLFQCQRRCPQVPPDSLRLPTIQVMASLTHFLLSKSFVQSTHHKSHHHAYYILLRVLQHPSTIPCFSTGYGGLFVPCKVVTP